MGFYDTDGRVSPQSNMLPVKPAAAQIPNLIRVKTDCTLLLVTHVAHGVPSRRSRLVSVVKSVGERRPSRKVILLSICIVTLIVSLEFPTFL